MQDYQTKRRNQIIAERTAAKAGREFLASTLTERELWETINGALERARYNATMMGHSDRAAEMARAQEAAIWLHHRGTQLSFLID